MPAFTIAASYLVASIGGIGLAAAVGSAGLAFITSAVAFGLAYTTARLLGLTGRPGGGTAQDPGVRQQFPPATNNKVPIVYGSAYQKGVITDARISNGNQTMTYVIVLSEKTATGTFSIGDIFWNDQKLVFRTTANEEHIVESSIDQNGTGASNSNFNGLIRIRVYAGDTNSGSQIFPLPSTGNTENAKTVLGESDIDYMLNDLVFALVQIDYNSEKGITGLGQVTFQVNNSLKNPGLVWYDYVTNTRYGAGFDVATVNTVTSISTANTLSLYSISEQIPPNQFLAGGTTATNQVRYEINGVLSTGDTVRNNIDKICVNSACWTTFDYSEGKWKLVPNRKATSSELASAFHFTDDNIISDISITATSLEDLYNFTEIEFASRKIRDQNDYFRAEINPSLRNDLEPDNTLNLRLDLVNNAIHAGRIGLIEMKQSRADLIITFTADYSAIQCETGDVVKITNQVYGFDEKLFRVTKIKEIESDDGSLTVEVTALQYDEDVYTDETLEDSSDTPGSGIPVFGGSDSLPAPSTPTITVTTGTSPFFVLSTTIAPTSGPVDEVQWYYSSTSTTGFVYLTNEPGNYSANTTVTETISSIAAGTWYFKARTGLDGIYGDLSTASNSLSWPP